jgi:hypothetical protein
VGIPCAGETLLAWQVARALDSTAQNYVPSHKNLLVRYIVFEGLRVGLGGKRVFNPDLVHVHY